MKEAESVKKKMNDHYSGRRSISLSGSLSLGTEGLGISSENVKYCYHNIPANLEITSKEGKNHGRRFHICSQWKINDCRYFEWFDKEEYGSRAIEVINWLKRKNDQLIEERKQLQSESERGAVTFGREMETGRLHDECSSYMFPRRQEEKEILQMKVKKLKEKNKDVKQKLFMVEAELENMKCTHVSKAEFERVIAKLVIAGFVLACVIVSISSIVVRKM